MSTLALVAALAAVSVQFDGASVAGSWTARFEDRTFLRLELKTAHGTITGKDDGDADDWAGSLVSHPP
jgi:hypothetical protein